ncbi:MAG: efflux RND transporter periplasmic adaptor subunit, partial [Polyangiales bacterium]
VNPAAQAAPRPEAQGAARRVRMPAELRARAGIRVEVARPTSLAPTVDLVGSVEFDGDHVAEVGSRIPGRVARLLARPGATVRAGELLAEVESASVGEAVAQYLSARAAAASSRAELARLDGLAAQRLATARELEQARTARATHDAEVQAATQRLLALGLAADDLRGLDGARGLHRVALRAPIAGRVVERAVVLGQVVEPATPLLRLADPSRLWVQLRVFERDLARVRAGDPVTLELDSLPGRTFHGTVGHVSAALDHETRTARVRVEVSDPDEALRPGQFVNARVRPTRGGARDVVTVARDATVQVEGRTAAFVEVSEGTYELRVLELGAEDPERIEVVRGLDAGERVVTHGAFALKSELLR